MLSLRDAHVGRGCILEISDWPDYMPPRESWAEPFWDGLTKGMLLLSHCEQCRQFHYPPVNERCPVCSESFSWVTVAGDAKLWSWSTFHHVYYEKFPLEPPYTVLMVELEEGIRMLTSLFTEKGIDKLRCDMKMKFKPIEIQSKVFIPAFMPE